MLFHIIVILLLELYVFLYSMSFDEMLHILMQKKEKITIFAAQNHIL